MTAASSKKDHPRCPRCGYDVSGDCSRWETQCPLEGTCPECGLTFEWRYLLNPALAAPAWLFDTNPSRFWGLLVKTLVRSLWPLGVARALRMEQHFLINRSLSIGGFNLILMHIATVLCAVAWVAAKHLRTAGSLWPLGAGDNFLEYALMPYWHANRASGWWIPGPLIFWEFDAAALLLYLLSAATFACLGESMSLAKTRAVHIVRAIAFGIPWLVGFLTLQHILGAALSEDDYPYLTWLAAPLLICAWWWLIVARYLRMKHAPAVAIALTIVGALATTVVFVVPTMYLDL